MNADNDFPRLDETRIALREGGKAVMTFGLGVRLIFRGGETREVRHRALDVLLDYRARVGEAVPFYQKDMANRLTKIGRQGFEAAYRAEIDRIDPDDTDWGPTLWGAEPVSNCGADAMLNDGLSVRRYPNSSLVARFPARTAREDADALIAQILGWCELLKPQQGLCGLTPMFELGMDRAYPQAYWPFLARFNGLDYDWGFASVVRTARGIKGANWLTILDAGYVDALGGKDRLCAAVGDAATVYTWSGGVLIRAGAEPQIGDVNRNLWPETYIAVNRVLRPIRFEDYPNKPMEVIKVPEPLDAHEETLKWVRRFDREEDAPHV